MTTSHEARIEAAAKALKKTHYAPGETNADFYRRLASATVTAYLAGDVVVPREATAAMLEAGQKAWLSDELRRSSTLYRAMVSAATEMDPAPPATKTQGE